MRDKARLLECFKTIPGALRFGDFVLRSGRTAKYYVDARKVALNSEGIFQVIHGMMDMILHLPYKFDTVGGMQTGADPITGALLHDLARITGGAHWDGFLWRKEVKDHGTKEPFEGTIRQGAKILLLDDVATTGGSLLEIAEKVKQLRNASVVAALVIVDRQEGAFESLAAPGIPLYSLLTRDDLLSQMDQSQSPDAAV